MHPPRRILVFPCGSEVGLEIYRSMRYSRHFVLVGGSSADDHGRFVFTERVDGLPYHDAPEFPAALIDAVRSSAIDAIFPTMDAVADTLHRIASSLPCRIIGSSAETTAICASKRATAEALAGLVPVPRAFPSLEHAEYPVFLKPDRGYGGRDAYRADSRGQALAVLSRFPGRDFVSLEYLPGREWTIDCFSDRFGELRFHGVRERLRVRSGISVRTAPSDAHAGEFRSWAVNINRAFRPRGAWFFQAREDREGQPRLLEVAARIGGSSGLFRCLGVNFALLSAFDAFDVDVEIQANEYAIEVDRALDARVRLGFSYRHVYVDLDDCLVIGQRVNVELVGFLYRAFSEGKRIILLTRHASDLAATLQRYRLAQLFDEVVRVPEGVGKSSAIQTSDAIFIDDSHAERREVARTCGIPVFAPDMVEALL